MNSKNRAMADLEPIERASRDEIESLQLERLQRTLRRAYDNVPHYRRAFDGRGVHPDDLKTLADLAKFPFTVKSDFTVNGNVARSASVFRSSGCTPLASNARR